MTCIAGSEQADYAMPTRQGRKNKRQRAAEAAAIRKKHKPLTRADLRSITDTISAVLGPESEIGRCGGGLPIAGLLSIVASYAVPFVGSLTTIAVANHYVWLTPHASCFYRDSQSGSDYLIVAETQQNWFVKLSLVDGSITPFAGSGERGLWSGSADAHETSKTAVFWLSAAVCVDPIRPRSFYLADAYSIRHYNEASDSITLIAGGERKDCDHPRSIIITNDGTTIWTADAISARLRRVTIATRTLHSVLKKLNSPRGVVWDRSPKSPPEIAVYVAVADGVIRYHIASGESKSSELPGFMLAGLASTASGLLLFSCISTHAIWSWNPETSEVARIGGAGVATRSVTHLTLVDDMRCLFAADPYNNQMRRIGLPPNCFPLPKCCARDL